MFVSFLFAAAFHSCTDRKATCNLLCSGLGGELREVGRVEQRLVEAAKLGFTTFVIPASHTKPKHASLQNKTIIRCKHVMEALKAVLGTGRSTASVSAAMAGLRDPLAEEEL